MLLGFCWFSLNMKDKEIIMCLTGFKQKQTKKTGSSFSGELSARLIVRIIKEKRISWKNMHKFETAIVFNHSFGRLKANLGPRSWQGVSPAYLMLISLLYRISRIGGHLKPCNEFRSQSSTERISRVQTGNLGIWSWSANLTHYAYSNFCK